jgi:hypothetical protein
MNRELVLKIADTVLYEGYMLYPYRPSALKNRQRWSFGILYPPDYEEVRSGTERSSMHSECLLNSKGHRELRVNLRFLHLLHREETSGANERMEYGCGSWDEGVPRFVEIELDLRAGSQQRFDFSFPEHRGRSQTESADERAYGHVHGALSISTEALPEELLKVSIEVTNETRSPSGDGKRNAALLGALLSAHLILGVEGGEFVSLLDPPEEFRTYASACRNVGNLPVLVGMEGERDMMLCSPIILYDYPQIAPESAGDFYDSTEMDEMLTLRVMSMSDEEKDEMRLAGEHARRLLERTEQSAREQLMRTHGVIRSLRPVSEPDGRT